jgi:putative transposase
MLLAVGHQFIFKGLESPHGDSIYSRKIRKKNFPGIRKKLWGDALCSPSYFAGSCGGGPIEIIRQHIEQQQTPH